MVGQGLQHPNLAHAAVPPSVRRRGMQPVEEPKHLSARRGTCCAVDVLISLMLGEQEPGQSQVLVLA